MVEVIEVDRPNAGSPASPAAACAGAATTVHGEPAVTSRSQRLGTVRVGGRTSELDAGAGRHCARFRSAYPTDRLLVVFELDGPIVDQRHMVRRRRGARLASDVIAASDEPGRLGRSAYAYFHVPMGAGIIVTAIADELTIAHPGGDVTAGTAAGDPRRPSPLPGGKALFQWTVFAHWSWSRAVAQRSGSAA
jgi:hypothetical protein